MEKLFNYISIALGVIGAALTSLMGGWDSSMIVLIYAVAGDYLTGVLKAVIEKKLSSEVGFKGISKKVMIFICVAFAAAIQTQMSLPVRDLTIWFFIANEGISLLENVSAFVPVPEKLKEVLSQLRDKTSVFKDKEE